MRTGSRFEWNPERIIDLRNGIGFTKQKASVEIGMEETRLLGLEACRYKPTVDDLIAMSKYYHVSINYILGLDDNPGDAYPSYEKYIANGGKPAMKYPGFDTPWPFNILAEVFGEYIGYVPNGDQMEGLYYAINDLTDRERRCVLKHYKDNKTLAEIAEEFAVGKERIRQIIAKAMRKLRNPVRCNYIRFGKEGYEKLMKERNEAIKEAWKKQNISKPKDLEKEAMKDISVINLNLSVRSYNCLTRSRTETIPQVIEKIEDGSIIRIRNLGKKSLEEILSKVNEMTGSNYTLEQVYENAAITKDTKHKENKKYFTLRRSLY